MSQWIARKNYAFKPAERVLITLRHPRWPAPEVRSAQYFPDSTPHFLVDTYGWQNDEVIEWVMALPAAPGS